MLDENSKIVGNTNVLNTPVADLGGGAPNTLILSKNK